MSNRRSGGSTVRGSQRGSSSSQWSTWEWNDQYQCEARYRQDRNGEWKWEYRQVVIEGDEPVPPPPNESTPRDSSTNLYSLPEESPQEATQGATQEDAQEHFTTDPDPDVDNLTHGMGDTYITTNQTNKQKYPSNEAPAAPAAPSTWVPSNEPRWIYTRNSNSKAEKADKNFKVHKSREFSFGRVFKVLWSEPTGSGGTEITERGAKSGTFQKHRRFLIVDTRKGHSICLPILTYSGQGTLKYGVHPEDHAAIYSSRKDGPCILPTEYMAKEPIRVEVLDPSYKLDPMSRLNYAKLYTVEHNVKILFIGKIISKCEQVVVDAYNATHRPLPDRPDQTSATTDDTFQHAEGQDPNHPQAMGQYSSSWTGRSITRPPTNDYDNSQDQYSSSWTGQPSTEPLVDDYDNSQAQHSSSWTGQPSTDTTEPPANDYDNSQDQYSSSWTGQPSTDTTEPLADDYNNSQDQYEAPPNLYDAEEE